MNKNTQNTQHTCLN